ncbi:MAG: hypothetical protein ACWGSQ_15580 [Longimicrobiales bacterium]
MKCAARNLRLPTLLFFIASGFAACDILPTDPMLEGEEHSGGPEGSEAGPATGASDVCPGVDASGRILVDASHDGGVWWFPQGYPFDPRQDHQGKALADHFRARGYTVDELGRGTVVTDSILRGYDIVIRAGKFGAYQAAELDAYEGYLSCETTFILLGEFLREGETDPVAERLGLHFGGLYRGTVTDFAAHPITEGVAWISYLTGSALLDVDPSRVTVLGRLDGLPVFGILHGYAAKVFFMGDTNTLELVPQPLVANLMAWGF